MLNLSGLSATYPGYMAQEDQTAKTQTNQAAAQEAAFKLLGAHVLGRALTGAQPGTLQGGPQPPAPGQPSASASPQPMAQGAPPVASQPAPGLAGAPPSTGGSGLPEVSLQALTQRILQTSPQVAQHPEVLLAALERAGPLLDRQSKEDLFTLRQEFQKQQLETRERMVRMQQEGLTQRNENSTGARVYAADQGLEGRRYTADRGLEGRQYTADSLARSRELSDAVRRDVAQLSWATRNEIAQRAEQGRTDRAELSAAARREIAGMNIDARREVTGMMEAGRDRRSDQASEDRRYSTDVRAGTAAAAEEGRNVRATEAEGGRMRRAEMSLETRQAMQRMSMAARQEIEDARQAGADKRAELSAQTRSEIAALGVNARKEITQFVEGGRNDRAAAVQQGQNDRAIARNDLTTRRLDQGDTREARLATMSGIRADQGYQRLEAQKQALAQRAADSGDKTAVSQWRAVVDAQHKLATEKIQATSVMNNMKPSERKALIDEQTSAYRAEIEAMRAKMLAPKGAAPIAPVPTVSPATAAADTPPVSMLKEGAPQEFKNGQTWTLENGVPKRLK